jgi:hypothetical protein
MRVVSHKVDYLVFGTGIADILGMLEKTRAEGLPGMGGRQVT